MVLWVMVVLSAVALPLAFSSHLRLQVAAGVGQGTQALYFARAGVERALADLNAERDSVQALADLRESAEESFCNVEIGRGTYTLFAGYDENGDPSYGIIDEAAMINVSTADRAMLSKVPGMSDVLADAVIAQRGRSPFADLNDLLLIENMSVQMLFGEDMNGNGILDANEDDGSDSWPDDDANGRLDRGLSAYLTPYSAARNVTNTGVERVDINSADAEKIASSVSGISQEQAESIVEHRKKNQFNNVVELLDVKMVKKVTQNSNNNSNSGDSNNNNSSNGSGNNGSSSNNGGNVTYQTTNQNAFDESAFRNIVDSVTTTDDEVRQGVVNLNTASEEVLACLPGLTNEIASDICLARERRAEGFQSIGDLLDVKGVSLEVLKQICPRADVRSDVFSVWSYGVIRSGRVHRCVQAVVDRTESVSRIRYWRELE